MLSHHYCGGCGRWEHCFWSEEAKYLCRACMRLAEEERRYVRAIQEAMEEALDKFS